MYICDLGCEVWYRPSCTKSLEKDGSYCALGKFLVSVDFPLNYYELSFILDSGQIAEIWDLNDTKNEHELAVRKVLQFAQESGKVKFINGDINLKLEEIKELSKV